MGLERLMRWLVSLCAGCLMTGLLFSFLAPVMLSADSAAHFRIYFIGGLLLLGLVAGSLRRRRLALFSGLGALAGLASIASAWALHRPDASVQGPVLMLLQLNLYYQNPRPQDVVAYVRERRPEVITLQEVAPAVESVIADLRADYPTVVQCGGTAVLSRLPLWVEQARGCLSGGMPYVTVRHGEQVVTIASLHLSWPYPFRQAQHVDEVSRALAQQAHPVILAGDFNAAPWSPAIRRIEAASQTQAIGGIRHTWFHRRLGLGLPIDHVLLPPSARAQRVEVGPAVGSDHRPVWVQVVL